MYIPTNFSYWVVGEQIAQGAWHDDYELGGYGQLSVAEKAMETQAQRADRRNLRIIVRCHLTVPAEEWQPDTPFTFATTEPEPYVPQVGDVVRGEHNGIEIEVLYIGEHNRFFGRWQKEGGEIAETAFIHDYNWEKVR